VHLDDVVPLGVGHVDDRPVAQDPGVVDQDVQRAELRDRLFHQPLGAGPVRHVVSVGDRPSAGRRDLLDHLLGGGRVTAGAVGRAAQVVDHDGGAFPREQQGVLPPEPAPGPGDDGHAAVECSRLPLP
jgi:hypothetical protein